MQNLKKINGWLCAILLTCHGAMVAAENTQEDDMTVYRTPTCGCCGKWTEHVKQHQFNAKSIIMDDLQAIKAQYGIPDKLASCHTAIVAGYVIEGHVPAEDINKLLRTKPNIVGIAAPGMPMGSPGMEMNGQTQAYRVMSFDKEGHIAVFAEHDGK